MDRKLMKAMNILQKDQKVIPEQYTLYNGWYIFIAYPKNYTKKEKQTDLSPMYLVDVDNNVSGPFSIAFVINDADKILNSFQNVK